MFETCYIRPLSSVLGNQVVFSLETASDYVKDEKACFFGFKCIVVGYEWKLRPEEVFININKIIIIK